MNTYDSLRSLHKDLYHSADAGFDMSDGKHLESKNGVEYIHFGIHRVFKRSILVRLWGTSNYQLRKKPVQEKGWTHLFASSLVPSKSSNVEINVWHRTSKAPEIRIKPPLGDIRDEKKSDNSRGWSWKQ